MNKGMQTKVRVLAEEALKTNFNPSGGHDAQIIAVLEVARQVSLLVEEQRAARKMAEEMMTKAMEMMKGAGR